ncbi:replication factor C subunit 3/5 [Babesia microti strain RI]|uniref:Replication factor C subunit 3/5 n=1 Tax=Babesia microti (strain RI) TaxID=1133968 RepID=A0A0K3AMS8_BABMR|nr:replication factor C subunit 3/5 [Babesia microti strain RI]CTQ40857.1 replication factor C subunit 3/5 [Babesia microti strain RI]|eukprot:XP_012648868.1 replication factor C subunit 3/5 [Babesia microti strain RI]
MLWIDKYAPRTIAGLDCHREINEVFTQLCKSSDIPHLILYGPSGSGKKARIMVLLREIFGAKADHIKVETLTDKNTNTEITVSQSQCHTNIMCNDLGTRDRVIVQNIIRSLCASSFTSSFFSKGPTFRVFVLHDADFLSEAAQAALRRTLEKHIRNARVFMHVKELSRIMPPLKSRCLCIRLGLPRKEEVVAVLRNICTYENISTSQADNALLERICDASDRNLRRSILTLETIATNGFVDPMTSLTLPWERCIKSIAEGIATKQTVQNLAALRTKVYELFVCCIPGSTVLQCIATYLLKHPKAKNMNAILAHLGAHFSHTMRMGSREIWHIEAFIAQAMAHLARQ